MILVSFAIYFWIVLTGSKIIHNLWMFIKGTKKCFFCFLQGRKFSIQGLLGKDVCFNEFVDGSLVIFRLAPQVSLSHLFICSIFFKKFHYLLKLSNLFSMVPGLPPVPCSCIWDNWEFSWNSRILVHSM